MQVIFLILVMMKMPSISMSCETLPAWRTRNSTQKMNFLLQPAKKFTPNCWLQSMKSIRISKLSLYSEETLSPPPLSQPTLLKTSGNCQSLKALIINRVRLMRLFHFWEINQEPSRLDKLVSTTQQTPATLDQSYPNTSEERLRRVFSRTTMKAPWRTWRTRMWLSKWHFLN